MPLTELSAGMYRIEAEVAAMAPGLDDPALLRAARVVRMSPRATECLSLAVGVCAP